MSQPDAAPSIAKATVNLDTFSIRDINGIIIIIQKSTCVTRDYLPTSFLNPRRVFVLHCDLSYDTLQKHIYLEKGWNCAHDRFHVLASESRLSEAPGCSRQESGDIDSVILIFIAKVRNA